MFRLPASRDWGVAGLAFLAFAAAALGFGFATGFFRFEPTGQASTMRALAVAFVLPALLEEVVFRGPLIWLAQRAVTGGRLVLASALSLALFVLWHPLNASLLLTEARLWFFDWRFLVIAAALGGVATWLALRTRSLWPPIVFHWLAVLGWKELLGGPGLL